MKTDPAGVLTGVHYLDGDYACGEGAMAAGCRFVAGYPITPSTEVVERISQRFPLMGGTFIQMEDELASMAAVVGASWTGTKSMTVTSGPGFSLMMENVGLAAMMEGLYERDSGRPASVPDEEKESLRKKVAELEQQLQAYGVEKEILEAGGRALYVETDVTDDPAHAGEAGPSGGEIRIETARVDGADAQGGEDDAAAFVTGQVLSVDGGLSSIRTLT